MRGPPAGTGCGNKVREAENGETSIAWHMLHHSTCTVRTVQSETGSSDSGLARPRPRGYRTPPANKSAVLGAGILRTRNQTGYQTGYQTANYQKHTANLGASNGADSGSNMVSWSPTCRRLSLSKPPLLAASAGSTRSNEQASRGQPSSNRSRSRAIDLDITISPSLSMPTSITNPEGPPLVQ